MIDRRTILRGAAATGALTLASPSLLRAQSGSRSGCDGVVATAKVEGEVSF